MAETTLTVSDSGTSVSVSARDRVRIRLPENAASTGYRWQLPEIDDRVIRLEGAELLPETGIGIGGARTREFVFLACSPGRATVRLICKRPWETAVDGECFEAHVNVTSH